ncbi:MAG TPA: TetR/AcrR family transcriptional regulator [Tepidisphaeraceae bacterium]
MQKAKPRRPGPPKAFDADVALKAAMFVFWRKGFDGATLSDLTRAMGINRPSLYATFGDKESLFSQAINRYGEQGQAVLGKCEFAVTARQFVEKLLRTQVGFYTEPGQPPGCFFIQGAIASGASKFAQETTRERRIFNEQALAARLSRGDWPEQIPTGFTPKELAAYIASIANGMAIRAADGASRHDLYRVVELALAFWPEHAAAASRKRKERTPASRASSKQPPARKRPRKPQ